MSLPVGAPPIAQSTVSKLVPLAIEAAVERDSEWVVRDVPAFYFSQGPPA
ncbi:hypothetical protein [Peristeroidobacter agariperforans]|nr:hypothetical protein [Peristeroidobacter agariperforans]